MSKPGRGRPTEAESQPLPASRAEIEAELLLVNGKAKRAQHYPGSPVWIEAHCQLNVLLTRWQACN